MKTTVPNDSIGVGVGDVSGLADAQEQGATTAPEPVAATTLRRMWTTARCRATRM